MRSKQEILVKLEAIHNQEQKLLEQRKAGMILQLKYTKEALLWCLGKEVVDWYEK